MRVISIVILASRPTERYTAAMAEVTQLLAAIERGQPQAAEALLPLVYDELRKLAAAKLAREKPGQTLQATALVHEAYVRLVGPAGPAGPETNGTGDTGSRPAAGTYWDSRGHFFAAAAEAMRRILVENARRKQAAIHGGECQRRELDDVEIESPAPPHEVLAVDGALRQLEQKDATAAQLVKLRYFSGLTIAQAAGVLDISPRTADRIWAYAKAWLYREIGRELGALDSSAGK
jgi:DNA-directed RNA polymerase specialized sigma24 family protein